MALGSQYLNTTPAWFPANCEIKLERKDTGSITTITTEVFNFSDGGGGKDTESIPHFGNAFLKIKKPQEDFEVSFDVSMKDVFWHGLLSDNFTDVRSDPAGSRHAVRTISDGNQDDFKIKLEWIEPETGSEGYKIIYYNATAVEFTKESAADDRLTATLSFKVPPTSNVGSGQKYEIMTADRFDTGIGSTLAGSYGAWESSADTLFGFSPGSML
ncbi:MAG: hypothetical protein Q8O88_01360 [bacterium]|nr:hypothetical protein [bacterium]